MAYNNSDMDVASALKYTEELKSELLSSVAEIYKSMTDSSTTLSERGSILADTVIYTYLLGEMLGVSQSAVDAKVLTKLRLMLVNNNVSESAKSSLLKLSNHIDKNRNLK